MQNYKLERADINRAQRKNYTYAENNLYKMPDVRPKRKKKISFTSFVLLFAIWGSIFYFVINSAYVNFLKPVYLNRIHNRYLNFDPNVIFSPTLKYASNLSFLNSNLLAPVFDKGREKVLSINSAGEIEGLKNELLNILSNYKNLHAGIYVYDYSTGKTVEINSEEVFPAASIIKIPVLLDLFNRSKNLEKEGFEPISLDKKIKFTEAHRTAGSGNLQFKSADVDYTIDHLARIMITQSDNSATNMLIEEIGGINELNASLRHWGFQKTQVSSFLPDLDGTNTTTPKDISTLLYNLDNQKFLPLSSSATIKEYMSKVENRTLIKSQMPSGAILIHKTGDIGKMLGDAGIIYTPEGKKFILAIMVKRPHNNYAARELIQKIAHSVYAKLSR